jgi:formylglycine-generating enzyme required for sulfatase activity
MKELQTMRGPGLIRMRRKRNTCCCAAARGSTPPRNCRSAYRLNRLPADRSLSLGFRVCCLPQD